MRRHQPLKLPGDDREITWNMLDHDFLTAAELDRDPTLSLAEAQKKARLVLRVYEASKRAKTRSNAHDRELIDPTPMEGDFFQPWSWAAELRDHED